MADFKNIYLPKLPSTPSVRYSRGSQRRAGQLQQFLRLLETGLVGRFGTWQSPELVLLSKSDWRQVYSASYGLPRLRGRKGAWQVYAPAEYPQKFIQRFEPLLLLGALPTGQPGELREFFDLLIAQTHLTGALRSAEFDVAGWLEPVLSAYALYGSLCERGLDTLAERFEAWAGLESRGGEAVSLAKLRSRRLDFSQARWAHGVSALYAAQTFEREAWGLTERLSAGEGLEPAFIAYLNLD